MVLYNRKAYGLTTQAPMLGGGVFRGEVTVGLGVLAVLSNISGILGVERPQKTSSGF